MIKPRKFIANIAAAFFISPDARRRVRRKILENKRVKTVYSIDNADGLKNVEKIMPGRFDDYDLIFSVGVDCRMVEVLIHLGLRSFSSPLDWTAAISPLGLEIVPRLQRDSAFKQKLDAIVGEFKDWFNFKDFVVGGSTFWPGANGETQIIFNTATGVRFGHLFPANESWERYYPIARDKIMHRADRLVRAIKASDRILICWGHRLGDHRNLMDKPVSDRDIKNALKKLIKKYPGRQFDLVFFEHDGCLDRYEYRKIEVCPGARRIFSNHFYFNDESRLASPVMHKALTNVSLSGKLDGILSDKKEA